MNIFYLTDLLSPYRIEWMNALSDNNRIVACSIYEDEQTRNKAWLSHVEKKFCFETFHDKFNSDKNQLIKYAAGQNFDIVIIDGYSSKLKISLLFYLLKNKRKVFINIDGIDIWRKKHIKDFPKWLVKRKVYRSGAFFLCGSKIAADYIIKNGARKEKVIVHPFTSIHDKDIISYEEKKELKSLYRMKLKIQNKKMALAVGRFIPLKRYDLLIEAWTRLPVDCELYLIGEGEEKDKYEDIISKHQLNNVHILDFMLTEQLNKYYIAADLFIHTSSTETWGLVVNEAMAKGVPVIASNHCVAGVELIRDGVEGYLFEVNDINDLTKKIKIVLENDDSNDTLCKNVIKRITPYTFERQKEIHEKFFNSVINDDLTV